VGDILLTADSQGFENVGSSATPNCTAINFQKAIDVTSQLFTLNVMTHSAPFTATFYFINPARRVADTTIGVTNTLVESVSGSGALT